MEHVRVAGAAGMLGRLEHEDLGALVAPRPLLVETGTEDAFSPGGGEESVRALRAVYDGSRRAGRPSCTTSSRAATSGTATGPALLRPLAGVRVRRHTSA